MIDLWTLTALALLFCLLGPFVRCIVGGPLNRLVGLQAGSSLCIMILLVLCEAWHRAVFVDIALTLALLSFGADLVFARFLERWL
ncbi:MAG: MrpF/PhaF family protein [Terriglobales bacterium]